MFNSWKINFKIIEASILRPDLSSDRDLQSVKLTYTPITPSLGGDPFDSSHLIWLDEPPSRGADDRSLGIGSARPGQSDLFVHSLSSRMPGISIGQVTDAIFGEAQQESETIVFGDATVGLEHGPEFFNLAVSNTPTGSMAEVGVPTLQNTP